MRKFEGIINGKCYTDESEFRKAISKLDLEDNIDTYVSYKYVSVVALFADPRRLLEWDCCSGEGETYLDLGILSNEIIKRLSYKYLQWYKQAPTAVTNNTQQPK